MKNKRIFALLIAVLLLGSLLAACGGGAADSTPPAEDGSAPAEGAAASEAEANGEGQVYYLNFKPEQDEAYQAIAAEYTEATGVPVKVITAASGTYEQQLRGEIAKSDAPTIFQINGPVGFASWKEYCADLSGSEIYSHMADPSLAITEGEGVYAIPFNSEGYGIIVNTRIMDEYFALDGAKAASLEEINSFDKLKEVAEDMQAKAADLGITGVFAATSLMPGEDWRWQTHLMNVPMHYEWAAGDVNLSDDAATQSITFEYAGNFQQIFDLYLNNSTVAPTMTGSLTVDDSMSDFALGNCAMVQNGNWAYGQIAGVDGNTVGEDEVAFLPIYIGAEGEENQGICIGTENYFCINKNASEADQQASLDFMNWLYTSDEGKAHVTNDLGFIAPFDSFTDADRPADPLGQQVMDWSADDSKETVTWDFTVFPSQQFKDDFGANLLMYAQGQMEWDAVVQSTIDSWAAEKAATATGEAAGEGEADEGTADESDAGEAADEAADSSTPEAASEAAEDSSAAA